MWRGGFRFEHICFPPLSFGGAFQRQQQERALTRPPSIHNAVLIPVKRKRPVRRKEPEPGNGDGGQRGQEPEIEACEDPAHFLELLNERKPERASSSMLRFRW